MILAVREGASIRAAAGKLGIAGGTLKTHLHHIYEKLELSGPGALRRLIVWSYQHSSLFDRAA